MNAKRLLIVVLFLAGLLSACAPAATQAPALIAQATRPPATAPARPLAPAATAAPTRAPMATSAPAYAPTQPAPQPVQGGPSRPGPMPPDNTFKDPGVNPFIDTSRDHLSTFAIDVDTASYTVARRYVNDGSLPPIDAVRLEEFVNYFDPGYNAPEKSAFAVYADGARSPFTNDGTILLRVGVQGYQVPSSQRKPASLTFVIDISGSMNMENRLGLVKRSLELLVQRLRPQDSVAVVVFGTSARVALQPTRGSDRSQIMSAINNLRTEGSTNAEAGLRLGFEMAMKSFRPDGTNKIILCSDGVANTGSTNPDTILALVDGFIKEGIALNTVGFGMGNLNDALLERLADHGNGMYAYVDTIAEAQKLFVDNLTSTLETIALDAKIQVDFNPDVVAYYRLLGYENRAVADQDFRNDSVDAGEIGAGHHVVAIYAIQLRGGADGRIATVQLRWLDPKTRQPSEINGNFNSWDLAGRFSDTTAQYQLAVAVSQYAEALRGSPWAGRDALYQASEIASSVQNQLPEDPDVAEFAQLVRRAAQMWRPGLNQ